jgi:hypothetical protein
VKFLEDILTPPQRKKFYALFGLAGVLLGAVGAGFAAAGVALPVAVKVAFGVYVFLGGAFGATATANVAPERP